MESLKGQLLIAAPMLVDPNFHRTVVLIMEHTDEGALGVVLNRPTELAVGDAVPDLAELADGDPIFAGGPVQPQAVIALAEHTGPVGEEAVVGPIAPIQVSDEIDELEGHVARVRVFAGYAGWSEGQLDDELAEEAWFIEPALPGDVFAGVVGVAPSHELMEEMRAREDEIARRGGPVADAMPERAIPSSAADGLRTIPPRETGGNLDIRQLVAGSRLFLPVRVAGALFSIGDLHFAQGDGEVCGTGIEVAGAATVRLHVRKGGAWRGRFPSYETPARPGRRSFATTGMPVRDAMDLTVSAREALLEMIDWLVAAHGLGREPAYALCSVAVDLRLSEVVDVPNPVVSALLPLDIFEP